MKTIIQKRSDQYNTLISSYLDLLPITDFNDFDVAIDLLKTLINLEIENLTAWIEEHDDSNQNNNNNNSSQNVTKFFKNGLTDLAELILSPNMYVENEYNFHEFITLVKTRIRKKIEEFTQYSSEEKQAYIDSLNKKQNQVKEGQAKLRQYKKPDANSETHVMSEAEWQADENQRLQVLDQRTISLFSNILDAQEVNYVLGKHGRWRYVFNEKREHIKFYKENGGEIPALLLMNDDELERWLDVFNEKREHLTVYKDCGREISELLTMDANTLDECLDYYLAIFAFGEALSDAERHQFSKFDRPIKSLLFSKAAAVCMFLRHGAKIDDFSQLSTQLIQSFCQNSSTILAYLEPNSTRLEHLLFSTPYKPAIFSFQYLIVLAKKFGAAILVQKKHEITWLAEHVSHFDDLISNDEFRHFFFNNFIDFQALYQSTAIKLVDFILQQLTDPNTQGSLEVLKSLCTTNQALRFTKITLDSAPFRNDALTNFLINQRINTLMNELNIENVLRAESALSWLNARIKDLEEISANLTSTPPPSPIILHTKPTHMLSAMSFIGTNSNNKNALVYPDTGEYLSNEACAGVRLLQNKKLINTDGREVITKKEYMARQFNHINKRLKICHEIEIDDKKAHVKILINKFSNYQPIFENLDKILATNHNNNYTI